MVRQDPRWMSIFEYINALDENELHDEIVFVSNFIPIVVKMEFAEFKYELFLNVFIGDAMQNCREYERSIQYYKDAIEVFSEGPLGVPDDDKRFSEPEIRFRLHKSYLEIGQYEEACTVLEEIPLDIAPLKVRYALAKMYKTKEKKITAESDYVEHFTAVCDSCVAYSALSEIIQVKGKIPSNFDGESEVLLAVPSLKAYIDSQQLVSEGKLTEAMELLREFPTANCKLSIQLALIHYRMADEDSARRELAKAHSLNEFQVEKMDLLAKFYVEESMRRDELQLLALRLMQNSKRRPESYIAFAYLARTMDNKNARNLPRALCLAEKACKMSKYFNFGVASSSALLVKARVLKELERPIEAFKVIDQALANDPCNYELHEASVMYCYHDTTKRDPRSMHGRDPKTAVRQCLSVIGDDPRAAILHARVLFHNGDKHTPETERILEPIVRNYPMCQEAAWLLMDHYDTNSNYMKGIEVCQTLMKFNLHPAMVCRVHGKLEEFTLLAERDNASSPVLRMARDAREELTKRRSAREEKKKLDEAAVTPDFGPSTSNQHCPPAPRAARTAYDTSVAVDPAFERLGSLDFGNNMEED